MKIYHLAKKQNLHLFTLQDMVRLQNLKERRLGALPFDWLKNLKQDEYKKATEAVDGLFRDFAQKADGDKLETLNGISAELVNKLRQVLRRDDIEMEYVDNGYWKECSKLTVGKLKYAFCTFFEKFGYMRGDDRAYGKYAEPQALFFTYKKMPHGRMAKPFMSSFSTDYLEYGYTLNKFIEKSDTKRAKTLLNPLRAEYREYSIPDSVERGGNMINNIIIDAGGIVKNPNYIPDGKIRHTLDIFLDRIFAEHIRKSALLHAQTPDKLQDIDMANRVERFLAKQIDSGVDLYKTDLRELLKQFSEEDRLYAKRMLRRFRSIHKLKCELKANNAYDTYKPYIEKTINDGYLFPNSFLAKELEILS